MWIFGNRGLAPRAAQVHCGCCSLEAELGGTQKSSPSPVWDCLCGRLCTGQAVESQVHHRRQAREPGLPGLSGWGPLRDSRLGLLGCWAGGLVPRACVS